MKDATRESEATLQMDTIPSMGSMLLRAAVARKKPTRQPAFEPICIRANDIKVDGNKLEKFNSVCGFSNDHCISMPYPHIMAFALHMQLMLDERFPFTPMGAVHVSNRIRQRRPLRRDETLNFEVRLGDYEQVEKGYEVGLITEVRVDDELIWDDLSVMLIRKNGSGVKKVKSRDASETRFDSSLQWELAANKGREYAAASGDYNPIHLYPITAKLMGFKRQIMHGMWSKSRTIAQLLPSGHTGAVSASVDFKLPIFLPSNVTLLYNTDANGSQFEMKDEAAEKPHLAGQLVLDWFTD